MMNEQDQLTSNGDGLNAPGSEYQAKCVGNFSYNTRSPFFLPVPNRPGKYVYFHLRYDFPTTPEYFYHVESFLYSAVDAEADGGVGAITAKNELIIKDTLCDMLAAVRHANGRDWWVACPQFNSADMVMVLLTPDGVQGPFARTTPLPWPGDLLNEFWWQQAVFSQDGARYARYNGSNGIQVMDFDRCTGEFAGGLPLSVAPEPSYACGIAFSPSGRFLYTTTGLKIFQFDLGAPDPQASRVLLAEYDGNVAPLPTTFNSMQLAPDGKIYVSATNGVYQLTVINNPDAPGLACNTVQHGVDLPVMIGFWLPNFPNFRLPALSGSACDTLAALAVAARPGKAAAGLSVWPNPASDYVQLGFTAAQPGWLEVYDVAGRAVWRQCVAAGSQAMRIETAAWPTGTYEAVLRVAGTVPVRARFALAR